MINYKIAIPSHCRKEILKVKTLKYLHRCNVNKKRIFIFVSSIKERNEYEKFLPQYYNKIVVAKSPLRIKRCFVRDYFLENEFIVNIDDDIDCLQLAVSKKELICLTEFDKFIDDNFKLMKQYGCRLWGVCSHNNPYFMKEGASLGLKYIIGGFFCIWNTHNKNTYVDLSKPYLDKIGCERSIKFFLQYGNVMRVNNVGMKTTLYNKGGLTALRQSKDIVKLMEESGRVLIEKYPQFVYQNTKRKSKYFEISLRNIKGGIKKANHNWW